MGQCKSVREMRGILRLSSVGIQGLTVFEDRLCPSDPKFPTLDEFELKTVQRGNEWYCHAVPKTANSRRIELSIEHGNTEYEARQQVIKRYKYIKGELK